MQKDLDLNVALFSEIFGISEGQGIRGTILHILALLPYVFAVNQEISQSFSRLYFLKWYIS
jgi:hypothetical protein